jgi:hypothetical protein
MFLNLNTKQVWDDNIKAHKMVTPYSMMSPATLNCHTVSNTYSNCTVDKKYVGTCKKCENIDELIFELQGLHVQINIMGNTLIAQEKRIEQLERPIPALFSEKQFLTQEVFLSN